MPICAICGEEFDEVTKCKTCGEKFCADCGVADEKLCIYCVEDDDDDEDTDWNKEDDKDWDDDD